MIDWKQRQRTCEKCRGFGYVASEMRHEDGHGPHAWAALCECQPKTMPEMEEAARQERDHDAARAIIEGRA